MCGTKIHARARKMILHKIGNLSGLVAVNEERFVAVARKAAKALTSFTNRFFRFSRPPGFRLALDAAKKNGKFSRIQCQ